VGASVGAGGGVVGAAVATAGAAWVFGTAAGVLALQADTNTKGNTVRANKMSFVVLLFNISSSLVISVKLLLEPVQNLIPMG
jgi:hypothetical protein